MPGGHLKPQSFTLPVSGSTRLAFSCIDAPWASFQLTRVSGSQDATFQIFTTNFSARDVAGSPGMSEVPPVSGSAMSNLWYQEPLGAGTAWTGSLTDAPTPFMVHIADLHSKFVMVQVSSSFGGQFQFAPHLKAT